MEEAKFSLTFNITVPIRQYVNDGFMITERFDTPLTNEELEKWFEDKKETQKKIYTELFKRGVENEIEAGKAKNEVKYKDATKVPVGEDGELPF